MGFGIEFSGSDRKSWSRRKSTKFKKNRRRGREMLRMPSWGKWGRGRGPFMLVNKFAPVIIGGRQFNKWKKKRRRRRRRNWEEAKGG